MARRAFQLDVSLISSQLRVGLVCASLSLSLGACSDEGEYIPPTQWVPTPDGDGGDGVGNVSPVGFWASANSDGEGIILLVTETGRFHLFTQFGKQAAGVISVSNENEVSANFQFITDRSGPYFDDGTTQSNCTLSGTVNKPLYEIWTMSLNGTCTTTAGLQFQFAEMPFGPLSLLHERASSLETIAGLYEDVKGAVIDIAEDGTIFAQEPTTNCVINGQVNIIDPAFNAYDFQVGYSSCTGPDADLNGVTFVGIGFLYEPASPIDLAAPVIGEIDGELVARFISGNRL